MQPLPDTVTVEVGDRAWFECRVATSALAQRIVWRHQNTSTRGVSNYAPRHFDNAAVLFIREASLDSGGTVECLLPCHGGDDLCVVRTFHLQPTPRKLRAKDVFVPPMRSVTVHNGSFSMTCRGRFDCSQTPPVSHFLWKYGYGNYVVAARFSALLGGDIPDLLNGSVTSGRRQERPIPFVPAR
ncbi:uncharacterized protein LOC129600333 [Paramacrobiotus metropolitanus]|uniref:uncharacterized protein LOC129600333 n=1 Tax=Paramacrobiotus metropolitanus TaxID=2943436 RepID=UPI0024457280|nr:uncharacterized protein LOC129600333 [Paramacrobiotus metropolitanus]